MKRILITAGPTREKIDSVRFISNFSTGNMGYELAKTALRRGYKVTLISGPTNLVPPKGANFIQIEDTNQMLGAVRKSFKKADCLFMASAVCDWRPEKTIRGKIKKGSKRVSLRLVENPHILNRISRNKGGKMLVGFALESKNLVKNAKAKLGKNKLDLIVANKVTSKKTPFGAGKTDVTFIDKNGRIERVSNATKKKVAVKLLDKAERLWAKGQ